jgi:hypothetical protein
MPSSPTAAYLETCDIWNQDYAKKYKILSINNIRNILNKYTTLKLGADTLNARLRLGQRDEWPVR